MIDVKFWGRFWMSGRNGAVKSGVGLVVILVTILFLRPCNGQGSSDQKPIVRTPAEVEALIKEAGSAEPQWWDEVEPRYPDTLDLSWPLRPQGPWNAQKNVGQYIWEVINPNPGRWREGIKFVHHLMIRNKDDKAKVARSIKSIGNMFYSLTDDWARTAFWLRKAVKFGARINPLRLAECYWKLGNKQMAVGILSKYPSDPTRHATIIKLWADMGAFNKAIRMAEKKAKNGEPSIGYLAAGDVCRLMGRYEKAIEYYKKALSAKLLTKRREGDFKQDKERARASIEAIKLFETLDMKRVADGTYRANSIAYAGQLYVEVKVAAGRIDSVRVTNHSEKQFFTSLTDTPRQIVAKQGVKGVDAVTSATMTSEAIINATAKALAGGIKKSDKK